jgi:hypothetical protein
MFRSNSTPGDAVEIPRVTHAVNLTRNMRYCNNTIQSQSNSAQNDCDGRRELTRSNVGIDVADGVGEVEALSDARTVM